jgi:hypothetical protein
MSKIIQLNSGMYQYEVPLKEPSNEKDIINFDLSKDEQFWHTPIVKNIKNLSQKQRIDYIERERQRWVEGVYVLINGELVYLTGMHYDHLTYMTFKGSKAEFFKHQVKDFYFRDYTRRDPKCRGRVFMKPRRYGMTMQEQTESTYSLLEDFSNNVGLQSDTKEKVRTTLLEQIINSYVKRPKFMRSDYYKPNGKLLVSQISLNSNLAPEDGEDEKGDYLLGWLKPFPSLPRAMDGNEMSYCVMDEAFKWTEASIKETLESNIKVLMGRNRAGMISVLSTMGDSDDYVNAVMEGCDIIARSNPFVRDENGSTLTGLYEYFVSAIYSFDIPPDVFEVNKFGEINEDKHLQYIHNKINKLDKNTKSYIFEKRRLPLCKEDALLSAQLHTYFRRVAINNRLNYLRGLTPDKKTDIYVRGNLVEDISGKIHFEYDVEGIWLWSILPYVSAEKNIDTRNRYIKQNGVFFPVTNVEGCIGYDTINYPSNMTTSKNLSRASGFIRKKFDYFNREGERDYITGIVALMLYRPEDPHEANYEIIKAAKFTGYPVMHERSVSHVFDDFSAAGMLPFLMKDSKGIPGISQSDMKAKKDGLAMLQTRYAAPKSPDQKDEIENYPYEDGLSDLDNFDINNTTKFDVTMSEIMCEHGLMQIQYTNVTDSTVDEWNKRMLEFMPTRNY